MTIDWRVVGLVGGAATIGALAAWLGQPLIHGNQHARELIATFFSILAGFLIAIMTILGDASMLERRTWRAAEVKREQIERGLRRHKLMFVLYLVTLGFLLIAAVVEETVPTLTRLAEHLYLGFGTFAFLLSMTLPWILMKIQLDRYDAMIQAKRRQTGLTD